VRQKAALLSKTEFVLASFSSALQEGYRCLVKPVEMGGGVNAAPCLFVPFQVIRARASRSNRRIHWRFRE
jgi:hypothetical protein